MQMDEKKIRTIELAKQMPDMTFSEWKLLSQFINDRFELLIYKKKSEIESNALFSEIMENVPG